MTQFKLLMGRAPFATAFSRVHHNPECTDVTGATDFAPQDPEDSEPRLSDYIQLLAGTATS